MTKTSQEKDIVREGS